MTVGTDNYNTFEDLSGALGKGAVIGLSKDTLGNPYDNLINANQVNPVEYLTP
jgi:hypothetical protein